LVLIKPVAGNGETIACAIAILHRTTRDKINEPFHRVTLFP
jgi:hypothetical protein